MLKKNRDEKQGKTSSKRQVLMKFYDSFRFSGNLIHLMRNFLMVKVVFTLGQNPGKMFKICNFKISFTA